MSDIRPKIALVVVAALVVMWWIAPPTLDEQTAARAAKFAGNLDDARVVCEDFVKRQLKAPSSARFLHVSRDHVDSLGAGQWRVRGEADAQNLMGGQLRHVYSCTVKAQGDGNYLPVQVVVGER